MFSTYNFRAFGEKLKMIREMSGLTQMEVNVICGVNRDTLRRIEQGQVIPKYETLETLSHVYKVDLLGQLIYYRSDSQLFEFYRQMDHIIINYDSKRLKQLESEYKLFLEEVNERMIDQGIYEQFQLMLTGVSQYYDNDPNIQAQCYDSFLSTMKHSIKSYDIEHFRDYKYTLFELRILLLIALGLARLKNYASSSEILWFILNKLDDEAYMDQDVIHLMIKIYSNLSYNAHMLDQFEEALRIAEKGIALCVEKNVMYCLFLLYFRRGIAKLLLEYDGFRDDFNKGMHLMEIQGKKDLMIFYRQIMMEKYQIEL